MSAARAELELYLGLVAEMGYDALTPGGTELARGAGLDVEGIVCVTPTVPWRRLLGVAEDVRARAIVVGSRGHGELTALILGSTSRALAHHSHLPLLIVPPETKG